MAGGGKGARNDFDSLIILFSRHERRLKVKTQGHVGRASSSPFRSHCPAAGGSDQRGELTGRASGHGASMGPHLHIPAVVFPLTLENVRNRSSAT